MVAGCHILSESQREELLEVEVEDAAAVRLRPGFAVVGPQLCLERVVVVERLGERRRLLVEDGRVAVEALYLSVNQGVRCELSEQTEVRDEEARVSLSA